MKTDNLGTKTQGQLEGGSVATVMCFKRITVEIIDSGTRHLPYELWFLGDHFPHLQIVRPSYFWHDFSWEETQTNADLSQIEPWQQTKETKSNWLNQWIDWVCLQKYGVTCRSIYRSSDGSTAAASLKHTPMLPPWTSMHDLWAAGKVRGSLAWTCYCLHNLGEKLWRYYITVASYNLGLFLSLVSFLCFLSWEEPLSSLQEGLLLFGGNLYTTVL